MKKKLPLILNFLKSRTTIWLIAALVGIQSNSSFANDKQINNTVLSLKQGNHHLIQVIKAVEEQTDFNFSFALNLVENRSITIYKPNPSLDEILGKIKEEAGLEFKLTGLTIALADSKNPTDRLELIKGQIVDAQSGETLPGVNILVKGTAQGTATDIDGNFTLDVNENDVLVISYIGYETIEVQVNNQTSFEIKLAYKSREIEEFIVTALGIKREEASLGYATQTISTENLTDARSNNWTSALSGKVAGLNVVGGGAGPMGSQRITLRGETSLNLSNNEALVVVDGVPINGQIEGTGFGGHLNQDSPVDFGSAVSDLNQDDIESVTVLKGPAAAALYGSRAANGALIITTKGGRRQQKGIGVSFNTNISTERTGLRWPDYQYEYGEGRTDEYYSYGDSEDGPNTSTNVAAGRAWGPKFDGQMYYQYDPNAPDGIPTERTPWRPYHDYIKGFFNPGYTITNNISVEGATDKSSGRISVTHLNNSWIVPNTGFERLSVSTALDHNVSDRLKINSRVNYVNKKSDNLPMAGYNNQTIMYFMIIGTTPSTDINWYRDYWMPGLEQIEQKNPFNPGPDNVYLQAYEMINTIDKHGVIGSVSATYEFSDKLNLMLRSGIDLANEDRTQRRPYSMSKFPRGMYRQQSIFNYEINSDLLLTYSEKINGDIGVIVSAGGNRMFNYNNFNGVYADQLAMPGLYMISNSLDQPVADPRLLQRSINSLYATSQFDYKGKIYLDLTGRNDWSSTLPAANNSFFYPSVSTSFILDELMRLPTAVSFSKLRLSYAQVGNDTRPYQTARYYDQIYATSFTNPNTLFNADLKPEITTAYEAGLDLRLFDNRFGIDFTAYFSESRNQILAIPLDITSGYDRILTNAGLIQSSGLELVLNTKTMTRRNFNWTTTFNWSYNRSYVIELAEGLNNQIIGQHSVVSLEARVGGRMGDLYGLGFQRSPEGEVIYTNAGIPAQLDPERKNWGNAFPDWKGGMLNQFTFGKFRASMLWDGQLGGMAYSMTNHKLNTLGKTRVTLPGRDEGIVGDGVVANGDGTFSPNTTVTSAQRYYNEYYKHANVETNIFDTSFIKLREARVEYTFSPALLSKIGLVQATVALYGRDLLLFTSFPAFDPEIAMLNSGTLLPGVEMTQFPSTRTMGMNISLKF
ncbi:TonB-dependent receptor [Indibacter alkaliphilus LW1]|uniref:TonB-dependent receptor n=1 Tax=Indibacter alkaliphilus (strain CCUG 57479 / KCTC 22604 / LW1) TaxID=1189612 RepID=S2DHR9_INDAL|nr:SusC/RagA family TonB-linked outer membrane protein [Indibacter alkaliphilus]EOZ91586.1 TonB-dependent receptor [Indibacter alkaliphilus LW1]